MPMITPKCCIKSIFIVSAVGFLLLNISLLFRDDEVTDFPDKWDIEKQQQEIFAPKSHNGSLTAREIAHRRINYRSAIVYRQSATGNNTNISRLTMHLPSLQTLNGSLAAIKSVMIAVNREQRIFNLDLFDLIASDSTIVIVVQVHNRPDYLRHLVNSLRKAVDIEQTLVIFSHDFYSDELNEIVRSVDFCPVMQIFYPYSMQLHPNVFPGEDPRDCPRNVNREQAMKLGCLNKDYPDKYGHYREANYCQTKNHWFWKINHAFDYLDVTRNFNGPVLLIEEDHYLVEDFVPVLRQMYRLRARACRDCNILTLGTYDKKPTYGPNSPRVDILTWMSSKHNMGMSLNRDTWNIIRNCSVSFCRFDDYNWDWSLNYIGASCTPVKFRAMIMKAPRIFHIGECGLHAKGRNCNPTDRVHKKEQLLKDNADSLFPEALLVSGYPSVPRRVHKANGGWGDIRDHDLCIGFVNADAHV